MAVSNNATLIEDHETAPTYTSIGGGQGAASESNFYFRGVLSSARKMSGVTKNGFWFTDATVHDVSAAGTHVKMFILAVTQVGFTDFWIRLGSTQTDYEEHAVGVGFYDNDAGGWIPVWVEVDSGTDTGTPVFTTIDEWAVLCSMGTISGNVKNFVTDQSHFATRPVLLWTSTGGDLDDFITSELTNGWGVLKLLNGLYTCFANFGIGSATATTFDMDGKVIAWPDATWLPAASVWMGVDIDLQNASTVITGIGGAFLSGNPAGASARKPDLIVTGTSGTLDLTGRVMDGMRIITLTSGVTADDCVISNCGVVTAAGASLLGAQILASSVAVDAAALDYDVVADPDGELDDMVFTKGTNAHHAVELGSNTPTTITLRGWSVSGFNVSDEQNDSVIFNNSGKAITINIIGGTGTFSVKNGGGASTILVIDPVALTVNVKDITDLSDVQSARVLVWATGTGPFPSDDSVSIVRSGATATVTHTAHGLENGDKVLIQGCDQDEYNGVQTISNVLTNAYDFTVSGAPATPATGTPISSLVFIDGDTSAGGTIADTRTYASDQDVTGRVRKSSAADDPKYKTGSVTGTVSSSSGLTVTVLLIPDA